MNPIVKTLVVTRSIVFKNGYSDKILLVKRNNSRAYNPDKWELPGGKIRFGKDVDQSLIRCIEEETGLIVKIREGFQHTNNTFVTDKGKYEGYLYIELTKQADEIGGKLILSSDIEKYEWINIFEALDYNLAPESKNTLAYYFKSKQEESLRTKLFISGKVLLRNNINKYLLIQRSDTDTYGGKWDLPGGKVSSLETLTEHLKREVFEEIGCLIGEIKPALSIQSQLAQEGKYKGSTYVTIFNEATITAGSVQLSKEHKTYGWFTEKEIFALDLAYYVKIGLTEIFLKVKNDKGKRTYKL